MDFFLKHLRVNRKTPLLLLAFQGGLFLMGMLIVILINATFNDDKDYAAIGSMMSLVALLFCGLIRSAGAPVRYRLAVSMGYTRRNYIAADPVITALTCLFGLAVAWVLSKFELWIYSILYPGWECEIDLIKMIPWWGGLLLIAASVVIDFCFGALQLRFGTKGFTIVWFPLCFAPMIIVNASEAVKEGGTSLFAQIGRGFLFLAHALSPAMWAAVGILTVLVLLGLSVRCYWKAEVRT